MALEDCLVSLQKTDNGRFEGDWVWNTCVTSEWVIVQYIVGFPVEKEKRGEIIRYFEGTQRPDGSWGWHEESEGYLFVTTLAYVSLRLLGVPPGSPVAGRALDWIHAQPDGVETVPLLGKIWLACIDLHDWSGINTIPPEMWSLPSWLPVHPGKYYTFLRMGLTSVMYVSGVRFRKEADSRVREIREELYRGRFDRIDWPACRHRVAATDLYHPPEPLLRKVQDLLRAYDRMPLRGLRKRSLDRCFGQILYEEKTSRHHTNTPFIGLLNCVAIHARDPNHPELEPSVRGKEAWKVEDESGTRYVASRSGVWDTAFAMQALLQSPRRTEFFEPLTRAYRFLSDSQIAEELPDPGPHAREPNAGGWSFGGLSELGGQLGWPVTDCTAESIVAMLRMHHVFPEAGFERISAERLVLAAEFLLQRQNRDGSYGHYERLRDRWILPRVNITEVWGSAVMIDFPCGECTGSVLCALVELRESLPSHRHRLDEAIRKAVKWQKSIQESDGSYASEWGIHYTYGTCFVVKGLRAAGMERSDPTLRRAADWLLARQQEDGGWGESHRSCLEHRYVERKSQVTMTSWALLALIDIVGADHPAVRSGASWLRGRIQEDGTVPKEGLNGVYFTTCGLDYRLYPVYFPTLALARIDQELATGSAEAGERPAIREDE